MAHLRHRYEVNGQCFTSQRQLVEHIRDIFRRHRPGSTLGGPDLAFIRALLERHPRAREKVGSGVRSIRVEWNPLWNASPLFVLVRTDGTETDFSFWKCVRRPSPLADLQDACRTAVVEDVLSFKCAWFDAEADEEGQVECPLTGRRLGWRDGHVDHMPPWTFQRIIEAFVEQERLRPENIAIDGLADGQMQKQFADQSLSERFRRLHERLARLRFIDAEANLRLPK